MAGRDANNPGYRVTRMEDAEPVLVVRRRCHGCEGTGETETPDHAAWRAAYSRLLERQFLATGSSSSKDAEEARREAGDEPRPHKETCQGCNGRGWNEYELTVHEFCRHLVQTLRVKGKKLVFKR